MYSIKQDEAGSLANLPPPIPLLALHRVLILEMDTEKYSCVISTIKLMGRTRYGSRSMPLLVYLP